MNKLDNSQIMKYIQVLNKIIRSKSGPEAASVESQLRNFQELQALKELKKFITSLLT